jgi:DNA-binding beta-propeller fold protein YncE
MGTDKEGNLYVANFSPNFVAKFDSQGNFLTDWGSYGFGDGQFEYCRAGFITASA